jgi:hypothetical protein
LEEEERLNIGGITWQTTSGWKRRRWRRYAVRVMTTMTMMTMMATTMTTMTMMATGGEEVEGEVEGEGEGEGRRGRGVISGPCHSKLVSFIVTILALHLFHYM